MFKKIKDLFARLIRWQKQPVVPPALSTEEHICANCGHTFTANFCPRCGQSYKTWRISTRNLTRIFLDTWGLGTHSFLRNIHHLLTRPGYMIGDYLDGRRQPYFPPFKTLFVVGTIYAFTYFICDRYSTIVDNNEVVTMQQATPEGTQPVSAGEAVMQTANKEGEVPDEVTEAISHSINDFMATAKQMQRDHMVLVQLGQHFVLAFLCVFIFRKAPRRPRLNFSENFVAQVYICAQMGFVAAVWMWLCLFCGSVVMPSIPAWLYFIILFIDFKQLYGFRTWGTLWRTLLAETLFAFLLALIFGLTIVAVAGVAGVNAAMG